MSQIRWYGPSVVLLATVMVVLLLGPRLTQELAHVHKAEEIRLVRDSLNQNPTLAELSDAFRMVARVVEPSVVSIEVSKRRSRRSMSPREQLFREFFDMPGRPREREPQDGDREQYERYNVPELSGNGSGWVYDTQGHIVTNFHVVEDADRILVRFADGSEREARLLQADPQTDIAVLKVEGDNLHPATLATDTIEQGDIVFAFGSPFRFQFSMSQGVVSAKGRELGILRSRQGYENFIQTDAAINPGNSGGPLTNIRGEVVGMNTAIATRTGTYNGLGFAIPVDMMQGIVEQLIQEGEVTRGYMGIYIEDLDPRLARTYEGLEGAGVLIRMPIPDGPAAKAGLQTEDIITHIDGVRVENTRELRNLVANKRPGEQVEVTFHREGKTLKRDVTVERQPSEQELAAGPVPRRSDPSAQDQELLRKLGLERVAPASEFAQELGDPDLVGVVVIGVRPGSAAAVAGIRPQTVITHVMSTPVEDVNAFVEALKAHDLGRGVRIRAMQGEIPQIFLLQLEGE